MSQQRDAQGEHPTSRERSVSAVRLDIDESGSARVHSSPETEAKVQAGTARVVGAELIALSASPLAVGPLTAEPTSTATPSHTGGLPRTADSVTTRRQQAQLPLSTLGQREQHPHTPSPLPTLQQLEVVDGFGHVRKRRPLTEAVAGILPPVSSTIATTMTATDTMRPAPANDQPVAHERIAYAIIGEDRTLTGNEDTLARAAADVPFNSSNRYIMPGTEVTVDPRQHNQTPFSTVNPAWLNQPWERIGVFPNDNNGHLLGELDRGALNQGAEGHSPIQAGGWLGQMPPAVPPSGQVAGQQPDQQAVDPDLDFGLGNPGDFWDDLMREPLQPDLGRETWQEPQPGTTVPSQGPATFLVPVAGPHGQDVNQTWTELQHTFPELYGADAHPTPPPMPAVDIFGPVHPQVQPTPSQQPNILAPETITPWAPAQPEIPPQPQRPIGVFGTDDQVRARDQQLRRLINAEVQRHFQILHGVVTGFPSMLDQPYEVRHRLQNEIWVQQTQTFEREFIANQNIDLAALAAAGHSFDNHFLQRQRQLIELAMRRVNGFPLAPMSPGSEMRLTRTVLEAQLRTLRAWSRAWADRLPREYLQQTVPGGNRMGAVDQGEGSAAEGVSAQEMEQIVSFGEFMESS